MVKNKKRTNHKRKHLRITYWNARGVHNKKDELKVFMKEQDIDVMLIGETFLKPHASFKIENYVTYRNDSKIKQGGTAILVKKNTSHTPLPEIDTEAIENTAIQIHTKNGPLNIFSTYIAPNSTLQEADIQKTFHNQTATILMGDLNCEALILELQDK